MHASDSHPPPSLPRRDLVASLYVGFILTGIVVTILGPILPLFISRWSLDDKQAGLFFSIQFLASTAGTALASWLTHAYGYRPALVLGHAGQAIGIFVLAQPSHAMALVATSVFGFGYGVSVPATNLLIAETGGARRAAAVSLLNLAWGVGALCCPLLILFAIRTGHLNHALYGVSIASAALTILFLFVQMGAQGIRAPETEVRNEPALPALSVSIALSLLFFLYVGTETSIYGWAATVSKRMAAGSGLLWTLAPMYFFAALLTGRGLAPLVLLRWSERKLAMQAVSLAAAGVLLVFFARAQWLANFGFAAAGLGCASLYPIYIAWVSKWFGLRARGIGGIMFTLAGFGGAVLPFLVGVVSDRSGALRMGLFVPLAGCAIMFLTLLFLRQRAPA
jgi:MFS transporter, FHS family, glucose/mannose:H+ symporter